VDIKVERGFKINCFAMISRQSKCIYKTSFTNINGQFIVDMLNKFADTLHKETVLVLDNASFHKSKAVKERLEEWQEKGLYIFYLPPYSPELNIAETLWRILKTLEIRPQDYLSQETLHERLKERLDNIGEKWAISFSKYNHK
jgi:transposase